MGKSILLNAVVAALGLILFGFGVYLTIQADIGAGPWDVLSLGLARTLGVKYGTASVSVSLIILLIDVLLRGKIGIGMFLDAVLVGKAVDLFNWLGLVPTLDRTIPGIVLLLVGLAIEGFAQYLYMQAALGCGPRDTLLVCLSKRFSRVPIGAVSICMLAVATFIGWWLGGPVGLGTILCAFLTGPIMQLEFQLIKFEAEAVEHQNIVASIRVILSRRSGQAGTTD
ncbi:MAG: hypothetical protein IKD96_06640 [Oscillospiraceae bacterium]|nr:hypothetical protein [Oscillospiraceae bacterium]